jgi:ribulose-phosphate 3-epimerase
VLAIFDDFINMPEISASILAADLSNLGAELATVDTADRIHVDVMDGHFVPNISFGFSIIETVQACTSLPIDIHLMVANPLDHIDRLTSLEVESVTVHVEATSKLDEFTDVLAEHDIASGMAINPNTDISKLTEYGDSPERITVMGVQPGFSGQRFQPEVLDRIEYLDNEFTTPIEVDGGITLERAHQSIEAGVDIIVSGSTIFESQNKRETIENLRDVKPRNI